MRKLLILVTSVGLLAALAACGGGGDDGAGVRTIGCDASGTAASGSEANSASSTDCSSASASAAATCEPVGNIATATSTVNVTLDEWVIRTTPGSALSGQVGFVAANEGDEPHELVVIKGVGATGLPLDKDGALAEGRLASGALIGEIEGFPAGETCDGVFALTPGEYVLVCNITETEPDGKIESHLAEGMLTTFTVN